MSKLTEQSKKAFLHWRILPAPQRGEYIRKFGEALRERKIEVAEQITIEAKKIISEVDNLVIEVLYPLLYLISGSSVLLVVMVMLWNINV